MTAPAVVRCRECSHIVRTDALVRDRVHGHCTALGDWCAGSYRPAMTETENAEWERLNPKRLTIADARSGADGK